MISEKKMTLRIAAVSGGGGGPAMFPYHASVSKTIMGQKTSVPSRLFGFVARR